MRGAPLSVGQKVKVQVQRTHYRGVDFAGGWYVGTVEAIRTDLPYLAYSVRTRKGDISWPNCDPACVRPA